MSSGNLLFVLCALACVVGALTTVVARNPVRGAVGLLTTIIGIAGLFLKLSAQFLAAIQLIVYAGAVVVLFVFVIMLLGPAAELTPVPTKPRFVKAVGAALLVLMAVGVAALFVPSGDAVPTRFGPVAADHGSVEAVGTLLFTRGVVPFEMATALLIVAVVGAIAVARGKQGVKKKRGPVDNPQKLFVGPLDPRDDSGRPVEEEVRG